MGTSTCCRGLGTYSVKLLTERYLGGAVTFTSTQEEGTTFRVCYPLHYGALGVEAERARRVAAN